MLTYFCGDHINKPVIMIAYGEHEHYDNLSLIPSRYDGKHIEEAYMYEYLRDFLKYLKQQSEMQEELENPPYYWIVDLKKNVTLWSGLAFKSSYTAAIKTVKEYYAQELRLSSKTQKYEVNVEIKGVIEVSVVARSFEEAKDKALNEAIEFTSDDVYCISMKAISALDENKTAHQYN